MISLTPSTNIPNSYTINWKSQQSHILEGLKDLIGGVGVSFTDVTLACEGEYIKAHKLVLSLCSPFFKDLFLKNRADKSNTIVILSNVTARNLRYLLKFMYHGKVDIPEKQVDNFLEAANVLKVHGLKGKSTGCEDGTTSETEPHMKRKFTNAASSRTSAKRKRPRKLGRKRDGGGEDKDTQEQELKSDDEALISGNDDSDPDYDDRGIQRRFKIKIETVDSQRATSANDDEMMGEAKTSEEGDCNVNGEDVENVAIVGETTNIPGPSKVNKIGSTQKRVSGRKTSIVWKFFIKNISTNSATCKLCAEKGKESILKTPGCSTTPLMRHLQRHHPSLKLVDSGSSQKRRSTSPDFSHISDDDEMEENT